MDVGAAVHLHLAGKADIDRTIGSAASLGLKVLRWDAPWADVERSPGKLAVPENWDYAVDQARAKGIRLLLILDYGNKYYDGGKKPKSPTAVAAFARYANFVATHFAGRVSFYETWNEWNSTTGGDRPGRAEDYIKLARATYPAIKRGDPASCVIVGSFVDYLKPNDGLQNLLDSAPADYGDAIGLHPYVMNGSQLKNNPNGFKELLSHLVNSIKKSGWANKPVTITEIGWHTDQDYRNGITEDQQTSYLSSALRTAASLGIKMTILYELVDEPQNKGPEGHFGLLRGDMSMKSSGQMVKSRKW